ncbi:MAG: hypothetical protein Ct9H300mP14_04640 [Gammaproteobacteria bacterium]|nr:MAG: hypothetical protein Ct9H300mP14_04640 [Gammaproteobacteria bacterium]
MLDLLPSARVGHVGLYRDPETLEAVEYYYKVPQDIGERLVIVVDPMLATANSGIAAVDRLKQGGPGNSNLSVAGGTGGCSTLYCGTSGCATLHGCVDRELNDQAISCPVWAMPVTVFTERADQSPLSVVCVKGPLYCRRRSEC